MSAHFREAVDAYWLDTLFFNQMAPMVGGGGAPSGSG
jgi:hypothetical protein